MPPITKNLIIINVLLYLATSVAELRGIDLEHFFALHFFLASDFGLWQLVTYMFMHGSIMHLLFNMFALWMFGRIIEVNFGPRRFIIYYMVCGIGAGLIQEITQYVVFAYEGLDVIENVRVNGFVVPMSVYLNNWCTVGASGAVYGILLAYGMIYPDERLFIFPIPIPIKAKFFVVGYAVIELLEGLSQRGDNVAHFAHLGGMLFGLLLILYWSGRLEMPSLNLNFRKAPRMRVHEGGASQDSPSDLNIDEDYNQRRQQRQQEVDRILEKVRKHGYGSLSENEKRTLFNAGQ